MMERTLKPYQLMTIQLPTSTRRRVVQTISYPIPNDDNRPDTIKVRMVPGEPTTMEELSVADLRPLGQPGRWLHFAEVRCLLGFPEDMLRYDGAALYDHLLPEIDKDGRELRPTDPVIIYAVTSHKTPPWTSARWASFCASIRPISTKNVKDLI